jgi:hypothetical protein
MKILRLCATLFSFGIVALGMLGIASPPVLLEFAQSLLVPPALYGVAAVRIAFGVLLLAVAGEARMPRALRVLCSPGCSRPSWEFCRSTRRSRGFRSMGWGYSGLLRRCL